MQVSPFPWQGPIAPDEVIGRSELLAELMANASEHVVTAVLGPRRYGKTSLLRRLAHDLDEVTTVWVDLYGATSMHDVVHKLDRGMTSAGRRFREPATDRALSIGLNLGPVALSASHDPARPEPSVRLQQLLEVLVDTARAVPTMLVVDEFSAIDAVSGAAGLVRTALQPAYSDLAILFAGSEPSVMATLFADRAQPFFGQAEVLDVPELPLPDVVRSVRKRFSETGREAGDLGGWIHHGTRGHPQRTMQLADRVWRLVPKGTATTDRARAAALEQLRAATALEHRPHYDALARGAQQVLRAVANGIPLTGARAATIGLSSGSASHNRRQLLANGDLVERDGELVVTDPTLADWLRVTMPVS